MDWVLWVVKGLVVIVLVYVVAWSFGLEQQHAPWGPLAIGALAGFSIKAPD